MVNVKLQSGCMRWFLSRTVISASEPVARLREGKLGKRRWQSKKLLDRDETMSLAPLVTVRDRMLCGSTDALTLCWYTTVSLSSQQHPHVRWQSIRHSANTVPFFTVSFPLHVRDIRSCNLPRCTVAHTVVGRSQLDRSRLRSTVH